MKLRSIAAIAVIALISVSSARAVTSDEILARVKDAEAGIGGFRADVIVKAANKSALSGLGSGYENLARLKKATVSFMKPDKIRYEGTAYGIKAVYIQNGYIRLAKVSLLKQRENLKNQPGKLQNSLDLGFLSSPLWRDNNVSVVDGTGDGIALDFRPKFGHKDKRHELVWIDDKTLRVLRRETYTGDGKLRMRVVNESFGDLGGRLPIAMVSALYDSKNCRVGVLEYRNVALNRDISESLFAAG